ncbi:hypothetical protein NPIL_163611 [Nephila pilipes]|uniref:Uncharacterized protein n=1 Tax=Nephila pilipes TaxID=299642 RepID=A0A8X6T2I1_NEPPI|nr:hypothetical protein NPIL_163611 [Nephila pilipes]
MENFSIEIQSSREMDNFFTTLEQQNEMDNFFTTLEQQNEIKKNRLRMMKLRESEATLNQDKSPDSKLYVAHSSRIDIWSDMKKAGYSLL